MTNSSLCRLASLAGLLVLVLLPFATVAGEKENPNIEDYGFVVSEVADTDNISAQNVVTKKPKTLRLANVLPFAKWPKDLTAEQEKLKKDGLQFLTKILKESPNLTMYGINKGDQMRGSVVVWHVVFTPGAPSTVGWGMVDVNLKMLEEGYTVYRKDPPEWFFSEARTGFKDTESVYKASEAYAIEKKAGIWKDAEFAKRFKEDMPPAKSGNGDAAHRP